MASFSPAGQQLYVVHQLYKTGLVTGAEKGILKDLILRGNEALASLVDGHDESLSNLTALVQALESLIQDEAQARFDAAYADLEDHLPAGAAGDDEEQTGREVDMRSFVSILHGLRLNPGGRFVDLGSGTGRACLAAALLFDFESVTGVEIDRTLHSTARLAHKWLRQELVSRGSLVDQLPQVDFQRADFSQEGFDVSGFDVVFLNTHSLSADAFAAISRTLKGVKQEACVVVLDNSLPKASGLCLTAAATRDMPWGQSVVRVYRRSDFVAGNEQVASLDAATAAQPARRSASIASTGSGERFTPPSMDSGLIRGGAGGAATPQGAALRSGAGRDNPLGSRHPLLTLRSPSCEDEAEVEKRNKAEFMVGLSSPQGTALLDARRRRRVAEDRAAALQAEAEAAADLSDDEGEGVQGTRAGGRSRWASAPSDFSLEQEGGDDDDNDDDEEEEEEDGVGGGDEEGAAVPAESKNDEDALASPDAAAAAASRSTPGRAAPPSGLQLRSRVNQLQEQPAGASSPQGDALLRRKLQFARRRPAASFDGADEEGDE